MEKFSVKENKSISFALALWKRKPFGNLKSLNWQSGQISASREKRLVIIHITCFTIMKQIKAIILFGLKSSRIFRQNYDNFILVKTLNIDSKHSIVQRLFQMSWRNSLRLLAKQKEKKSQIPSPKDEPFISSAWALEKGNNFLRSNIQFVLLWWRKWCVVRVHVSF